MNQGLCGLGEGVGDAVAETLSQTGPAKTAAGVGAQGRCCSSQPRDRFYLPLRQRQDTVPGFLCEPSPQSPCSASGPGLRVALYLFWMDLDSQPLCPTIWVMFLASHQALLSGKRASLLMGGGAARSSAGNRAPTTNHNIMASSAKILHLHTERKTLAAKKPGQAAHFSYPEEVLGRSKHRSVPTSPPQGSSQNTAQGVGCATLPPSSSKDALGQPDTCVTSPCAWDSSRLFLISHHPKLGQEKSANQKCHCHESSQAGEVPHHRNVFI